jgi:hypothetical protein
VYYLVDERNLKLIVFLLLTAWKCFDQSKMREFSNDEIIDFRELFASAMDQPESFIHFENSKVIT